MPNKYLLITNDVIIPIKKKKKPPCLMTALVVITAILGLVILYQMYS